MLISPSGLHVEIAWEMNKRVEVAPSADSRRAVVHLADRLA